MRKGIFVSAAIVIVLMASAIIGGVSPFTANANLRHYRELLIFDFAASEKFVSFPVVLAADTAGLIVLDRKTRERKIIYDDGVILHSPNFSKDGKRLLYVKRKPPENEQQLTSCTTVDWRCRTILKAKATIFSPVELEPGSILYASSPFRTVDGRNRADRYDLYLLKEGASPVRLTEFGAYQLSPISVGGHRVLMTAVHGKGLSGYGGRDEAPVSKETNPSVSHIFSLDLAGSGDDIVAPERPLTPHFLIPGYSTHAGIAPNGQYVAFLNRRNSPGRVHFNLAVADSSEKVIRYIGAKGYGFSMPVFVGQSIVANELLADGYEVKEFRLDAEQSKTVFQLDFSVETLMRVPRISISLN